MVDIQAILQLNGYSQDEVFGSYDSCCPPAPPTDHMAHKVASSSLKFIHISHKMIGEYYTPMESTQENRISTFPIHLISNNYHFGIL